MHVKTVLKGRYDDNTETRNVFYHNTSATSNATVVNAALEFLTSILTVMLPIITTKWTAYGADIYEGDGTVTGWQQIGAGTLVGGVGTSAENYNANQDAAVLLAKTTAKKSIGKKFIAGIQESGQVNGQNNSATLGVLANILAIWVAEFAATNGVHLSPEVWRKAFTSFAPIIGGFVAKVVGSQRRRKPNLGI